YWFRCRDCTRSLFTSDLWRRLYCFNKYEEWYGIVGNGYIRLLMMIVVPLVMVSIIQSIINLEKSQDLGKMSAWIIGILVSTAMIAALVGIGSAAVFDLNAEQIEAGQSETEQGTVLEDR